MARGGLFGSFLSLCLLLALVSEVVGKKGLLSPELYIADDDIDSIVPLLSKYECTSLGESRCGALYGGGFQGAFSSDMHLAAVIKRIISESQKKPGMSPRRIEQPTELVLERGLRTKPVAPSLFDLVVEAAGSGQLGQRHPLKGKGSGKGGPTKQAGSGSSGIMGKGVNDVYSSVLNDLVRDLQEQLKDQARKEAKTGDRTSGPTGVKPQAIVKVIKLSATIPQKVDPTAPSPSSPATSSPSSPSSSSASISAPPPSTTSSASSSSSSPPPSEFHKSETSESKKTVSRVYIPPPRPTDSPPSRPTSLPSTSPPSASPSLSAESDKTDKQDDKGHSP